MPYSNPVVAGETLVIPAVQSDGFVTGVSGWRIQRDGAAEFNDVDIRGTLEVTNAFGTVSVGKFLVGGAPAFRSTETSTQYTVDIYAGTVAFSILGGSSTSAQILYSEQTGSPAADSFALYLFSTTGPDIEFALRENSVNPALGEIFASHPIVAQVPGAFGSKEDWHNFGASAGTVANPGFFSNGWANFGAPWQVARYRIMPDGTVAVEGLVNPGTMVAGTIMATLPVGYRPAADHIFSGGDGTAAGAVQEILVRSNGQIQVGRITGTHSWEFRFALPQI